MVNRAVYWHEGQLLRPQHFQAAEAYHDDALTRSQAWAAPYLWGLRRFTCDAEAIANFQFVLRSCEARFQDGTLLSVPEDVEVDPIDLRGALRDSGQTTVSLAVPSLAQDRANVAATPESDGPRYWLETLDYSDRNTGADRRPVQFRRLRARLLVQGQDTTGYEVLPLARIERSARTEAPPSLARAYIPPLLALEAWQPLVQELQEIYHQVGGKISLILEQATIGFDTVEPGDLERILKLQTLNGAYPHLRQLAFVTLQHPLPVYQELCRLAGLLAIFTEARRPVDLPTYDHDDLGVCFGAAIEAIKLGLQVVAPRGFEKRYLERIGDRLQVDLEPSWLIDSKTLFLGVETDLSEDECDKLLLNELDMKMGSGRQVERIYQLARQGLKLRREARPPRKLPADSGIVYYSIARDSVFWQDVADSYTVAVRMNLEMNVAFQTERTLDVQLAPGRASTLTFALFVL